MNTRRSSNPISNSLQFFSEAKSELKKVHFPTRKETMQATFVVIAVMGIFALFLGLVDALVGSIMSYVLS